jgi:hypothetical protein
VPAGVVGVELTWVGETVPAGAALTVGRAEKNTTIWKLGPLRQLVLAPGEAAAPAWLPDCLVELCSVTRVTPSIVRSLDINRATSSWVFVHPVMSKAGAEIALRRPLLVAAVPPALAEGETVALSD